MTSISTSRRSWRRVSTLLERPDALLFDLDGTLWDASEASAEGWSAALRNRGITRRVSPQDIRGVSGLPFAACVTSILPDLAEREDPALLEALEAEERAAVARRGGKLYPGVAAGIAALAGHYRLFLVSNCQGWYLDCFWRQTGLRACFVDADCHGESRLGKARMIERLAAQHRLSAPLYVGDTARDRDAAEEAGVGFGHAAYGFGSVPEPLLAFASFEALVVDCLAAAGRPTSVLSV